MKIISFSGRMSRVDEQRKSLRKQPDDRIINGVFLFLSNFVSFFR